MTPEEIETQFDRLQKNDTFVARAMMLMAHGGLSKEQALMLAVIHLADECEMRRNLALELLKRLPPESLRVASSGAGLLPDWILPLAGQRPFAP